MSTSRDAVVWLSGELIEAMARECDTFAPEETGGALLGYQEAFRYLVVSLVGAGPGATHAPDAFVPDGAWQREEIARQYEASGRRLQYLGDWHSHPSGLRAPSLRDWRTALASARTAAARQPHPLTAILSPDTSGWQPAIWYIRRFRLHSCQLIGDELPAWTHAGVAAE